MATNTPPHPDTAHRMLHQMARENAIYTWQRATRQWLLDNGYMTIDWWPAYCVVITDAGYDFLRKGSGK